MDLISPGMEFASEMIIQAGILSLRLKEIPIKYYRDSRDRPPHLRRWRDGWKHLRLILLHAPQQLFFVPGFLLLAFGILCIAIVLAGASIGGYHPQSHVAVFGSIFAILGYQVITLGIVARMFSISFGPLVGKDFFLKKYYTLERGIIGGGILIGVGSAISVFVISIWILSSMGPLNMVGLIAAAATLIISGFQTIFSSFLLDVIRLWCKHEQKSL